MLFRDAIKRFINHLKVIERSPETVRSYNVELATLNRYLEEHFNGPVYLDDLSANDFEIYFAHLKEKECSTATRRRMVYIIRSFYNYCLKADILVKNEGRKLELIPIIQKEREYLTEEEFKKLVPYIEHTLIRLVVIALYYTGLRISECLNLTIDDVDLSKKSILVRNTKSKQDRRIPIHELLYLQLKDYKENWREGTGSPYFFATRQSGRLSPGYVNEYLHKADEQIGWSRKTTCHILRHSFASNLVKKKVSLHIIQRLLGHSSLKVTGIYMHADTSELVSAINEL